MSQSRTYLFLGLVFFSNLFAYADTVFIKNHSWALSDINSFGFTQEDIIKSLRTNWDREALDQDLAHLYSYQIFKKFNVTSGKIFLFTDYAKSNVATFINDDREIFVFDHQEKVFHPFYYWISKYSDNKRCYELANPSEETTLKMQINRFNPGENCYYVITPGYFWQQLEIYPTSLPRDYLINDIIDACFEASDRKLFRKDRKRCQYWAEKI